MYVNLECGCYIDDAVKSTVHDDSTDRSTGDIERKKHHYPIHAPSKNYCISCDFFRPCFCDNKKEASA